MGVGELVVVSLAWLSAESARPALQCEGPDVEPWVTQFRDRVDSYDALYRFGVQSFGAPTSCEGAVTMEFDGARFGSLLFDFGGRASYSVEMLPPESSVATLWASGGFADAETVRRALEERASAIGLAIDWSTPEISEEEGHTVHTFWDPEPGLNASASLIFSGDALVGVRLSTAL